MWRVSKLGIDADGSGCRSCLVHAKSVRPCPRTGPRKFCFCAIELSCICRTGGKVIQIHHLDGDPSNHDLENLAALCLDCHDLTQIRGGFGRRLDAEQIVLFRADWHRIVALGRAAGEATTERESGESKRMIDVATTVTETYREREEFQLLAIHYHHLGNFELRDKYVEQVLSRSPSDSTVVFFRGLQGRTDAIPADVIEREEARYARNEDYSQRARFYETLGRHQDAVRDYMRAVADDLDEGNTFAAACYLKELATSGLWEQLFMAALREKVEEGDMWWQFRALEELGWSTELSAFLVEHADEIRDSGNLDLLIALAEAEGEQDEAARLRKEAARRTRIVGGEGEDYVAE
jgi:tetratricopeptide (TPR) repeat protein